MKDTSVCNLFINKMCVLLKTCVGALNLGIMIGLERSNYYLVNFYIKI